MTRLDSKGANLEHGHILTQKGIVGNALPIQAQRREAGFCSEGHMLQISMRAQPRGKFRERSASIAPAIAVDS